MAQENKISIQISEEDLTAINTSLAAVRDKLDPLLVQLTSDEKRALPKMSDKTLPFVEKVKDYSSQNPEFVPSFLDIDEFVIDYEAFSTLTDIHRQVNQIAQNMNDTLALCGSEAYKAALLYYNNVKQAAKANVPNSKTIYEDLKKRFSKQTAAEEPVD